MENTIRSSEMKSLFYHLGKDICLNNALRLKKEKRKVMHRIKILGLNNTN